MAYPHSHTHPVPSYSFSTTETYALVDTCSKEVPSICSWSDNGTTFTIYDQERFEQQQIPLYFKHSKFSSFVRQLNFYSFRKIKDDVIRVDSAAQNYWKFRHACFQRGQPQRLSEMKRMANKSSGANNTTTKKAAAPDVVQALQQRMEEMNRNIDALTAMVEKVSLQQKATTSEQCCEVGTHKRKKLERQGSSMKIEDDEEQDKLIGSCFSPVDDDAFVEELFEAFHNEDQVDVAAMPVPDVSLSIPDISLSTEMPDATISIPDVALSTEPAPTSNPNRPDPQLMQKLSDCLEMLPKPMQEMIVTRLIESITEGIIEKVDPSMASELMCSGEATKKIKSVPVIPVHA